MDSYDGKKSYGLLMCIQSMKIDRHYGLNLTDENAISEWLASRAWIIYCNSLLEYNYV